MKGLRLEIAFKKDEVPDDNTVAELYRGASIMSDALKFGTVQIHRATYSGDHVITFTSGQESGR